MNAEQEFQKANDLYQSGDLQGAETVLNALAKAVPDHPDILHFLSVVQLQSGNPGRAADNLKLVTDLKPDWPGGYDLLGVALRQAGRLGAAERQLKKAIDLNPDFAQAYYNLGNVYRDARRFSDAAKCFNKTILIDQAHLNARYNLGEALRNLGMLPEASAAYQEIVDRDPNDFEAALHLADTFRLRNMHSAARPVLEAALTTNPDNPSILDYLAQACIADGDPGAALGHLDRLISIAGERQELLRDKAAALRAAGDVNGAVAIAERAVEIDPEDPENLFYLAYLLERINRTDDAQAAVDRGAAIDGEHPGLALVAARLDRRGGNPQAGVDRLRRLPEAALADSPAKSEIHFELGHLYERLNRPGDAIENLTLGNRAMVEDPDQLARFKERTNDYLERMTNVFNAVEGPMPAAEPVATGDAPAFVVGFPRSGTTLLDQVLDAHPGLQVLEEQPTLSAVRNRLAEQGGGFPENLFELSEENLSELRAVYTEAVDACVERTPNTRIVDKMPLNIVDVGLIHRLFPQAKIILALRHPCDVCLSCFMQPFEVNHAMAHFTSLDDTVAFYDKVMDLWHKEREILPIDVFEVRYEDLVTDLETVARGVLDFLDLPWDDAVMDPTGHARSQGYIGTSSYHQVVEEINTRAVDRWRKFELHMAPFMLRLKPHIQAFGYDDGKKA